MVNKDILHDLDVLIRSRYSLIFLNVKEENRAETLLRLLADHMNMPFFTWSLTKGLLREDIDSNGPVYNSRDILVALSHIESISSPVTCSYIKVAVRAESKLASIMV